MSELNKTERFEYASQKLGGAIKWMYISGTATFFLTGILDVVAEIQLPYWATLLAYLIINTAVYGISKYAEGEKPVC